jgi:hypothetical protein
LFIVGVVEEAVIVIVGSTPHNLSRKEGGPKEITKTLNSLLQI